jgi:hypothetical protein
MNNKHFVAACLVSALSINGEAALATSTSTNTLNWHLLAATQNRTLKPVFAIPETPPSEAPLLSVHIPEHRTQSAGFLKSRTRSYGFEAGDADALIETTRSKSERVDGLPSFVSPRTARIETRIVLENAISPKDRLAVIGSVARERRRPAVLIAQHNHMTSSDISFSVGWNHDEHFQLSMGVFDIGPTRQQSVTDRLIAIASGVPRSASGIALSFNLVPIPNRDTLSLGFNLRRQNTEWNQPNSGSGRVGETVGAISARLRF